MDRKIFKQNLQESINEIFGKHNLHESRELKFSIVTIHEVGKDLNSNDDYMRLWILSEKNINNRYLDLEGVVNLLSGLEPLFPIWINVKLKEECEGVLFFELQTSLRFRKPRLLRNQETGHPPFKALS